MYEIAPSHGASFPGHAEVGVCHYVPSWRQVTVVERSDRIFRQRFIDDLSGRN